MKLGREFFDTRNTLTLAEDLLGKVLTYESEQGVLRGIIVETEAYTQEDPSCHAFQGKKTKRTHTMFNPPGHLYVYFTYGMYYCANIVAEEEGRGCAVLIRSIIPIAGLTTMLRNRRYTKKSLRELVNGPAKICMAYGLDKRHDTMNLLDETVSLYIEDKGYTVKEINTSPRIGISQAKEYLWRFFTREYDYLLQNNK